MPTATKRGFIALTSVLILGAIMLVVGLTAAAVGQTQLQLTSATHEELRLRDYAAGCLEEAILRLRLNEAYVGPTTVALDGVASACTVESVSGTGSTRTVTVAAHVGSYTKKARVALEKRTNPAGNAVAWVVDSWIEVDP